MNHFGYNETQDWSTGEEVLRDHPDFYVSEDGHVHEVGTDTIVV